MGTVHVVHCVDTEGPLYESLEATFDRLHAMFGLRLPASPETLEALRRGEIDLGGKEAVARLALSERLLTYNDTWDKVDLMLHDMMGEAFRESFADPSGNPWTFSWFCVDHVGYSVNPRRRDIGFHNVFDHYRALLSRHSVPDEIHWHVHPMSTYGEAHRNAISYLRSPHVLETMARRVIDRGWFPVAFRPGFHVERPDSHWLLEQFVPFDFGNQALADDALDLVEPEGRVSYRDVSFGYAKGPNVLEGFDLEIEPGETGIAESRASVDADAAGELEDSASDLHGAPLRRGRRIAIALRRDGAGRAASRQGALLDLDRRLAALVEDRIQDTQGRKDARAKQAGARFARRFVVLVPIGMALAGMQVGEGRAAYATPAGQVAALVAIGLVAACWMWAGRIMQLPEPERVFA